MVWAGAEGGIGRVGGLGARRDGQRAAKFGRMAGQQERDSPRAAGSKEERLGFFVGFHADRWNGCLEDHTTTQALATTGAEGGLLELVIAVFCGLAPAAAWPASQWARVSGAAPGWAAKLILGAGCSAFRFSHNQHQQPTTKGVGGGLPVKRLTLEVVCGALPPPRQWLQWLQWLHGAFQGPDPGLFPPAGSWRGPDYVGAALLGSGIETWVSMPPRMESALVASFSRRRHPSPAPPPDQPLHRPALRSTFQRHLRSHCQPASLSSSHSPPPRRHSSLTLAHQHPVTALEAAHPTSRTQALPTPCAPLHSNTHTLPPPPTPGSLAT